mmetsp:Transcript_42948/g.135629  ORF Transcript_42948/g.135629 Transcript_42948/m.135629 type:complete len:239 (+) Transcript_42948:2570-3286(+)
MSGWSISICVLSCALDAVWRILLLDRRPAVLHLLHFLGQELNAAGPSGREVTNTSPPVSSVEELASEEDRPSDLGDLRVKHPPVEREAKAPGRDSRPARGPACLPSLSVSAPRQVTSQHVLSSQRNLLGVDGSGSVEEAEGGQVPGPATARVLTPVCLRLQVMRDHPEPGGELASYRRQLDPPGDRAPGMNELSRSKGRNLASSLKIEERAVALQVDFVPQPPTRRSRVPGTHARPLP